VKTFAKEEVIAKEVKGNSPLCSHDGCLSKTLLRIGFKPAGSAKNAKFHYYCPLHVRIHHSKAKFPTLNDWVHCLIFELSRISDIGELRAAGNEIAVRIEIGGGWATKEGCD
jgi:hypothetical protein